MELKAKTDLVLGDRMEPDITSKDTKASQLQVTETKYEGSKPPSQETLGERTPQSRCTDDGDLDQSDYAGYRFPSPGSGSYHTLTVSSLQGVKRLGPSQNSVTRMSQENSSLHLQKSQCLRGSSFETISLKFQHSFFNDLFIFFACIGVLPTCVSV